MLSPLAAAYSAYWEVRHCSQPMSVWTCRRGRLGVLYCLYNTRSCSIGPVKKDVFSARGPQSKMDETIVIFTVNFAQSM